MGRRGSRLPSPTIQQGNERVGDGRLFSPVGEPPKVNFNSQTVVAALFVGGRAGEGIDAVVLRMAAMAFDPMPFDFVRRGGFEQFLP